MGYSVPTTDDGLDAGKTTAVQGGALGVGESLGRSLLGPGLGTALGGIAVASMNEGTMRDVQATVTGERAVNELMAGGAGSSSNDSGGRGTI